MSDNSISYVKMNGLGNEVLVVDLRASTRVLTATEAAAMAAAPRSHFDQMMVLHKPVTAGTAALIRIYNTDGSLARACGNGMRCVAWAMVEQSGQHELTFETVAGILTTKVESQDRITVDMGRPRFAWNEIPLSEPFHDTRKIELQIGPIDNPVLHSPSVANIGNPHAIFWVTDVAAYDLAKLGSLLEYHPIFPERANISLAHVRSRTDIQVRTWERGAGLTRACGSAACATAVAAARKGLAERRVTVNVPGGPLEIDWRTDDHIYMTGPAEVEYRATVDLDQLQRQGA